MSEQLLSLVPEEVEGLLRELGEPRYRAQQLLHGVYRDCVPDIGEITTLPRPLRERLKERLSFDPGVPVRTVVSEDGETTKALLRFADGALIESVLMQYPEPGRHPRSTVCVSTQAGCAMGCTFCATGLMGFRRNLTAGEIVAQVLHFARQLRARREHVTHVVFMGMGEPLANYRATVRAIRILTDPRMLGLSRRHITVSTVGLLRGIDRLAEEGLGVNLAISLHAPNDELRRRLIPTAPPHSVAHLVRAARRFRERTGRRVTFEYVLIEGVNDQLELAEELASLLQGTDIHVNLIPLNPTASGFRRPSRGRVLAFERALRARGVNCTVRVEKGTEISAACGQLRTDVDAAIRTGAEPMPVELR